MKIKKSLNLKFGLYLKCCLTFAYKISSSNNKKQVYLIQFPNCFIINITLSA